MSYIKLMDQSRFNEIFNFEVTATNNKEFTS